MEGKCILNLNEEVRKAIESEMEEFGIKSLCYSNNCPYYRKNKVCPAREGCAGYTDEVDVLRSENEYLRMRLAEIRDKVNQMEPPEGFTAVYNHAYHAAKEDVKRIIE